MLRCPFIGTSASAQHDEFAYRRLGHRYARMRVPLYFDDSFPAFHYELLQVRHHIAAVDVPLAPWL